jgi:hypothetical protein
MFGHGFGDLPREILGRAGEVHPVRERETFRTVSLVREGAGPESSNENHRPCRGDRKMLWGGAARKCQLRRCVQRWSAAMPRPNDLDHIRQGAPLKQPKAGLERALLAGDREFNPLPSSGEPATYGAAAGQLLAGQPGGRSVRRRGRSQVDPAKSALRLVHSAGVARVGLLIGRVRRLSRSSCHGGAPGERQDDEERGEPSWPVHQSPRSDEPIKMRLPSHETRSDFANSLQRARSSPQSRSPVPRWRVVLRFNRLAAFAVGDSATGSDTLPPARGWRANSRATEGPNPLFLQRGCEPDLRIKAKVWFLHRWIP